MKRLTQSLLIVSLLASGCSARLIETPDRFLALQEGRGAFDYRATSADGVVIAARVLDFDAERGGGLPFWIDAVKLRLSSMGGYSLLDERDVKTSGGLSGKQLRFGHDENKRPYQYWIAMFVTGNELVVVEAGGPEDKLVAHEARVQSAIASLKP